MRRYADLLAQAFVGSPSISIIRRTLAPAGSRRRWAPSALNTLRHHGSVYFRAWKLGRQPNVDLFHVVDGSHGYVIPLLGRCATVVTVHDVIPALQAQGRFSAALPSAGAGRIIALAIRGVSRASAVICVSESTKRDLGEFAPHAALQAKVIYPPLEAEIHATLERNSRLANPFVLHIGNNAFYKNRTGVIQIFAKIAKHVPHRLVMAGPNPTNEMRSLVASLQLNDRVDFAVDPSDLEVSRLYGNASLLLFPSVYEGFGWPPLEAMAMGCPVVCSDSGSLPEVVGEAALLAKHDDFDTLAAKCCEVLLNEKIAARMRALGLEWSKQFTLERLRDQLSEVYCDAVAALSFQSK